MLVRSLRKSPLVLLFLALCAFLGWHKSGYSLVPAASKSDAVSSNKGPKTPRIAVVTFITDEKSYVHLSLKNKDHYARRHGYDFVVDYEAHTDRGTTYWKFNMMERLIKTNKWDWIWWVDFDTLITNTDIKVADIIEETLRNATVPDDIDYLTTHDCNGLNTGSFLVRGHERSIKFLHDIYTISDHAKKTTEHGLSEQDSMAKIIADDKASGARTMQVPQWKLNAFPKEIACFDKSEQVWEPGMFVIHFAGAWAHVKGEDPTGQLMTKYKDEIIWGDWKNFYE
ncbi:glycosyltransferase family 34 protein [Pleomassaria siparia CBS 279.74]|uniref:Glycosyltransferase family 34 protein n=1 Tax=Pleomassaria siparia CBS 279.74 TaxID=1314801 RepID=A0A6G1JXY8_9PLEO|nr:glycosyltransferase family 34 protein [Pleomassaria siparia CBS 279.74]